MRDINIDFIMEITAPTFDWSTIGSLLIVSLTGIIILVVSLLTQSVRLLSWIAHAGIFGSFLYTISLWGVDKKGFGGMVILDDFSLVLFVIILFSASMTLFLSKDFLQNYKLIRGEYLALICFATFGMMVMVSGGDLMMIFLGIETLSIALYILAGTRRTDPYSLEAAFKYFLVGAFASGFLLFGMAYMYGATGSTNLDRILSFLSTGAGESNTYMLIGIAFLIIGLGFKVALVPFHMWTPDVYEGAPTPIAAFMSTGVKAAGFAVMLRVILYSTGSYFADWQSVMWVLAVVTMTVGNVIALAQENVKRMLAYSSIAHAGYMLVGFAAGTDEAFSSVIYYLASYTFMNIGAFGVVSYFESSAKNKSAEDSGEANLFKIKGFSGLGFKRPVIAAGMAVFMFSLAGIPPTAGFFAKFYVFRAAVDAGLTGLAVLGALNAVISVYFYLRVVLYMYMYDAETDFSEFSFRGSDSTALILSVIGIFILGLFPSLFLGLASVSLF